MFFILNKKFKFAFVHQNLNQLKMEAPTTAQLNPYLTFDGNCEEVINYYHSVLGGETDFKRFSEGPSDMPVAEGHENKIMHVRYTFESCILMASDSGGHYPVNVGNNFHLSVYLPEKEKAAKAFESFSKDGEVTMPFQEVFWGGSFGSVKDKYGVSWMFSCP